MSEGGLEYDEYPRADLRLSEKPQVRGYVPRSLPDSLQVCRTPSGYSVPIDTLLFLVDSCRMNQPETATAALILYAKLRHWALAQRLYENSIRTYGLEAVIAPYVREVA